MATKSRQRKRKPSNPKSLTPGTVIRMEEAGSDRKPRPSKSKVVVTHIAQEVNPVSGFFDFLREHAVIGLIIGFVLGQQVQILVTSVVNNFVNPLTTLLFGQKLSERTFKLTWHDRTVPFGWGAIINAVIVFLIVLFVFYVVIKLLNLDDLEKKESKDK